MLSGAFFRETVVPDIEIAIMVRMFGMLKKAGNGLYLF